MLIPSPTATTLLFENLIFFTIATLILAVGIKRYPGARPFPGPVTPWPAWFKVWFKVIWVVGFLLPILILVGWGGVAGESIVWLAIGPYFLLFFLQIGTEQVIWKKYQSPMWVAVPCLYLPWRVWQCVRGLETIDPRTDLAFVEYTLWALLILWIINIGVHFTGIPASMRWNEPRANA